VTACWSLSETRSSAPLARVPTVRREHDQAAIDAVDVSFVTVTYGTGPVVVEMIASLVEAMETSELTFEVVVVDNAHPVASTRSRNELALSTAGVRLVRAARNLGFGGGCELGALHARGRILGFLNPDLLVSQGCIQGLIDRLDDGPSIIAPTFLSIDGTVQEIGRILYCDGSTEAITDRAAVLQGQARRPDYASAACWLIHRDEHERLGGFDPAFHPAYYEDVEFALRATRLGRGIEVAPDVTVVHHGGKGTLHGQPPPETAAQRDVLLDRHPDIRWTQPLPPGG
jgi:O-antigen biosynthesis protein